MIMVQLGRYIPLSRVLILNLLQNGAWLQLGRYKMPSPHSAIEVLSVKPC